MWSIDFWQRCKGNSVKTQYFQQMVLEQVDNCINHVFYFLYFMMFWHFKKLTGWGETAPLRASQFLAWEHSVSFICQLQPPHYLTFTHQANIFSSCMSSQGQVPSNQRHSYTLKSTGLFKITNSIWLILPYLAFSSETPVKALYFASPHSYSVWPNWYFSCGPVWHTVSLSLGKCK